MFQRFWRLPRWRNWQNSILHLWVQRLPLALQATLSHPPVQPSEASCVNTHGCPKSRCQDLLYFEQSFLNSVHLHANALFKNVLSEVAAHKWNCCCLLAFVYDGNETVGWACVSRGYCSKDVLVRVLHWRQRIVYGPMQANFKLVDCGLYHMFSHNARCKLSCQDKARWVSSQSS